MADVGRSREVGGKNNNTESKVREARLKRLESKKTHWMNTRMAKGIVLELITKSQNSNMEDWYKSEMVELLLEEVVLRSEVAKVMMNMEMVTGMESKLVEELQGETGSAKKEPD